MPAETWFVLEAEAVDNHIRVWVDGKTTVDWVDTQRTYRQGHFAIQIHDAATRVQVRKLEVMELDAQGRPLGGPAAAVGGDRLATMPEGGATGEARRGRRGGPAGIRAVPTRPGVLKVAAALPGSSWPALLPGDVHGWRAGDPSLVATDAKGLHLEAGSDGNFLITRDPDYKKCSITVDLSVTEGTEAYLVLRASEGPEGWRGVTSRIVDEGGKIHAGLQSVDFALPERGEGRVAFAARENVHLQFSIDAKNRAEVVVKGKVLSSVVHGGPGRADDMVGAVGLFVRKGSLTIRSLRRGEMSRPRPGAVSTRS